MKHFRLLIGQELLLARRNLRALVGLALLPCAMLVGIGLLGALANAASPHEQGERIDVSVNRTDPDLAEGIRRLGAPRLVLHLVDDPQHELVVGQVDVAVVGPAHALERVAAGQPIQLTVIADRSTDRGAIGAPLVRAHLERLAAGMIDGSDVLDATGSSTTTGGDQDLSTRREAGAPILARFLPALLVLTTLSVLGRSAVRLNASQTDGSLEALWILPVRRSTLVVGLAAGVAVIGLAVDALILVPSTVVGALIAAIGKGSAGVGLASTIGTLVATVACAAFLAAAGAAMGARTHRTGADGASVGIVLGAATPAVAVLGTLPGLGSHPELLPVPVLGPMVLVARGLLGTMTALDVVTVIGSSALLSALLVQVAVGYLRPARAVRS